MKVLSITLCAAVSASLLTSCITPDITALSSNSMRNTAVSVNPAMSVPDEGFHPYLAAAYGEKTEVGNTRDSAETSIYGSLSAGFYSQPDLQEQTVFGPFYGLALSGSVINYAPHFYEGQYDYLVASGFDIDDGMLDYSLGLGLKMGLLFKTRRVMFSAYLLGIGKYEDGDYASLRQELDDVIEIYNLVDNPLSYGIGAGFDTQFGSVGSFDIGICGEISSVYNSTQSVSYRYVEGDSEVKFMPNENRYGYGSLMMQLYFDYENVRVSVSETDFSHVSVQVAYRF